MTNVSGAHRSRVMTHDSDSNVDIGPAPERIASQFQDPMAARAHETIQNCKRRWLLRDKGAVFSSHFAVGVMMWAALERLTHLAQQDAAKEGDNETHGVFEAPVALATGEQHESQVELQSPSYYARGGGADVMHIKDIVGGKLAEISELVPDAAVVRRGYGSFENPNFKLPLKNNIDSVATGENHSGSTITSEGLFKFSGNAHSGLAEILRRLEARESEKNPPTDPSDNSGSTPSSEEQGPEVVTDEKEPETGTGEQEPAVVTDEKEPETDTGKQEPEVVIDEKEPETGTGEQEPEVVAEDKEPETGIGEQEPEVVTGEADPDTETGGKEPDVVTEANEPETDAGGEEPEVVAEEKESETDTGGQEPEVVTEDKEPEVQLKNTAPIAADDGGFAAFAGQAFVISAARLLANDVDDDGDTLAIISVSEAKNGSVKMLANGDVEFTPTTGFNGTAQFSYTINDGSASSQATASIDVDVDFTETIGNWWSETIDLSASGMSHSVDSGLGNDEITGSQFRDKIDAGGGDDRLIGLGGNDDFLVASGDGFDEFEGGAGYDRVLAQEDLVQIGLKGDFKDTVEEFSSEGHEDVSIVGTWQSQVLDFSNVFLNGITQIDAAIGNDTVTGSAGDDVIVGGLGDDTLFGNGGDDDFLVGLNHGYDVFEGGFGFDQVLAITDAVNIGLKGSFANEVEEISANGFSDVSIVGNWQSQSFDFSEVSLDGIAAIKLHQGHDTVIGSAGNDRIEGGIGDDTISGGLGSDTYVFHAGDGNDVVTDFAIGEDLILLDAGTGLAEFSDVQSAMTQNGTAAYIDLGGGNSLTLENTQATALSAESFDFI